jgi:Pyridoxamine 5'-phosphate oxidase
MNWGEFAAEAAELASLGMDRFERTGLALVGTITAGGYPRISPVEVFVVDGHLMLGMMWKSRKALDLLRNPRVVVHSTVSDREGTEGDFKLSGRAIDVPEPDLRMHYADTLEAKISWRPSEPFNLFRVDIERAGFVIFGKAPHGLAWDPKRGLRRLELPAV